MVETQKLLRIEGLKVSFKVGHADLQVVRGLDLQVDKGEIVGILGESGSGKTVSVSSILGLLEFEGGRIEAGRILYEGNDVLALKERERRRIRGKEIAYIFQNPLEALNPYRKIGEQIKEALQTHALPWSKTQILDALRDVGMDQADIAYDMYPRQLSGGQCQRIMIAMGLVCRPKLIIADEATSAIDSSLQRKILALLQRINETYQTSVIVITHDFDVARYLCQRLVIMYGGLVMEEGGREILQAPLHPYTRELLRCAESLDRAEARLYTLTGRAPNAAEFAEECPFYGRCPEHEASCRQGIPELKRLGAQRAVRCLHLDGEE